MKNHIEIKFLFIIKYNYIYFEFVYLFTTFRLLLQLNNFLKKNNLLFFCIYVL